MKLLKIIKDTLGPGVITGIADDDPSGIGTYSQTGAMFGLSQVWIALWALPFMVAVQEMCGRIGMVTGKGLAAIMRDNYSKATLTICVLLLVIANTVNIGADLGMMASAVTLVAPIPFISALVILTGISIFLEVFVPYPVYVKFLKYMALTVFMYILAALSISHNWGLIFEALFHPHFEWSKVYIINIVALLGTTISPYLFFWQTDEEVEEQVSNHHKLKGMGKGVPKVTRFDIQTMRRDTFIGMFIANIVMFFIMITTAHIFHANGITSISETKEVAEALRPIAGDLAYLVFALGVIGTGMLAVPILAGSAAYAIAESFKLNASLSDTWSHARAFYAIITISTVLGVAINMADINPVALLYYSAIVNGLLAPPLLFMLMRIANNKKIMGDRSNGTLSNILVGLITFIMTLATTFMLASQFIK